MYLAGHFPTGEHYPLFESRLEYPAFVHPTITLPGSLTLSFFPLLSCPLPPPPFELTCHSGTAMLHMQSHAHNSTMQFKAQMHGRPGTHSIIPALLPDTAARPVQPFFPLTAQGLQPSLLAPSSHRCIVLAAMQGHCFRSRTGKTERWYKPQWIDQAHIPSAPADLGLIRVRRSACTLPSLKVTSTTLLCLGVGLQLCLQR